ncbi:protease complex subunit PrcB family protein [Sporomusa sp.]|uniref:protease complex subunit PrcB family protein n=1 Tax=Sporomusa sp. TaxID=2078658 RepID=UPI002CDD17AD|nr:protease complex subunit PrcB family protein [Sporomusa sp.]HWR42569.1 protease complex subunit PrcB family protein [Sporomusa sp.]
MNINKKQIKFISAVTGLAVLTAATSFAALPEQAAAKWLNSTRTMSEVEGQLLQTGSATALFDEAVDSRIPLQTQEGKMLQIPIKQGVVDDKPAVVLKDTAIQAGIIKTIIVSSPNKVDVGPGVAYLDYAKVIKWQQNVDAGYERWRLDPLQVAHKEGKNYGFTDKDTFTIVKRLAQSELSRHGEIHVKVTHNGKDYTMILVKPFGGGDAIWTTYKVVGQYRPAPPAQTTGKTLFSTDKYADWSWHKERYLKDMAFATVVDYNSQLNQDKRIPENVLSKVKDIDYNKKVVLFAYLGTAPSGGYGVGIEKVVMNGNKMTVTVHTKSPRAGSAVTLAITQPSDYVVLDKTIFDIWGGVDITFVDQNGKVLSKNKLTISHR